MSQRPKLDKNDPIRQARGGLRDAMLSNRAEKRKPTLADAPPLSVFPGRKVPVIPGQTDLFTGGVALTGNRGNE